MEHKTGVTYSSFAAIAELVFGLNDTFQLYETCPQNDDTNHKAQNEWSLLYSGNSPPTEGEFYHESILDTG